VINSGYKMSGVCITYWKGGIVQNVGRNLGEFCSD